MRDGEGESAAIYAHWLCVSTLARLPMEEESSHAVCICLANASRHTLFFSFI